MQTHRSQLIAITIERPWMEVYEFAVQPSNMTLWAAGLGHSFVQEGPYWVARDHAGNPIKVKFAARNDYGVLDHDVHIGGVVVHVALRVMPNGDGAEVAFLLLQEGEMSDAAFDRDAAAVQKDLETLKRVVEAQ